MRPQRALSMSSSARRVQWKAPERLVSTTACHSSAGMRMVRPSWRTPALLTSTRIGPKRSRTASKAAWTCSGSLTSACTSPEVRLRRATFQPSLSRRSAMAAPMPRVPPVTRAQPSLPSRADMHALLPAHDARAPHEAGAEGGQGDGVTGLQAALALGLLQRERDRGRGRIGHTVEVDDDLLARNAQLRGGGLDDADVGLVGDEEVDVPDGAPGALERLAAGGGHPPHGVAVDVGALHAQDALVALGVEQVGLRSVGTEHEAADAELELAAGDDRGAGAVAEEHGRRAIVVVDDAAEGLGAAHEHDRGAPGLDEGGGLIEAVEEARAGRVEVDRRGALGADDAGHLGREARRHAVGRESGDDDVVDLGAGAPGVVEGQQAGARRQVGERLVALEVATLADAGAAHDPLVVGVQALLEVRVGDDVIGQGGPDAEDAGGHAAAALGRQAPGNGRRGRVLGGCRHAHAATWRVRLTRPVRTSPGPSSTKRSTRAVRSASSVSRQRTGRSRFSASSRRTSTKGAALPLEYTGRLGSATGVASRAARRRSAAGSMSGEWKAPVTSRRRARAPVSSRATSSASSSASTGPLSTSWPGALSLATTRPRRAASVRTSRPSPPSIAIMPPAFCSPASAMAGARSSTRRTASSSCSAPAATRAAYSPSEWPAAAIASASSSPSSRHASQAATEQRNSAGCW